MIEIGNGNVYFLFGRYSSMRTIMCLHPTEQRCIFEQYAHKEILKFENSTEQSILSKNGKEVKCTSEFRVSTVCTRQKFLQVLNYCQEREGRDRNILICQGCRRGTWDGLQTIRA